MLHECHFFNNSTYKKIQIVEKWKSTVTYERKQSPSSFRLFGTWCVIFHKIYKMMQEDNLTKIPIDIVMMSEGIGDRHSTVKGSHRIYSKSNFKISPEI